MTELYASGGARKIISMGVNDPKMMQLPQRKRKLWASIIDKEMVWQ
jgi:hypothetical protein